MPACCGVGLIKLTKATVLQSNHKNETDNTVMHAVVQQSTCEHQASSQLNVLQSRVVKLREKMAEANINICTLKAFVDQTVGQVTTNGLVQKGSQEIICELKNLLVSLEEILDYNDIITQRGVECLKIVDKLDNVNCKCGTATPSVESIRRGLHEIAQEKGAIDQTILLEKCAIFHGKVTKSTEFNGNPKTSNVVATGIQHCDCPPKCKPKMLQTEQKYKVTEGTNPSLVNSFSKGQNVNMKSCCKAK